MDWSDDGAFVIRSCVDAAWLTRAEAHLAVRGPGLVAGPVGSDPSWLALARHPGPVAAASRAVGPGPQIFSAYYVVKPPCSGLHARWHQDGGSWPIAPQAAATVWVALDDVGPDSGGMCVIPRSHHLGLLPHTTDERSIFGVGTEAPDGVAHRVELQAGDASIHHPLLVHSSGPNRTTHRRAALIIRYVAADVKITADGWPSLLPTS